MQLNFYQRRESVAVEEKGIRAMKVVLRKRYYCDHCKKAGGSPFWMKRHEDGCTLNPKRICGMCKLNEEFGKQRPIELLISALNEDIANHEEKASTKTLDEQCGAPEPIKLCEVAHGCPACMLAAIRQTQPTPYVKFDWKHEQSLFLKRVYE